jgi:PAS domain S-box-containing protein
MVSPIDGREKLLALLPVGDRPLVLAVTRDLRDALAPWYGEMASASIRVAASLLLVFFTIVAALRQLRRIEAGERRLRQSEERYAMVMEAANEGHSECDLLDRTVFVSSKWKRLHGLDDGHPIDTIEEFWRLPGLHADDAKIVRAAIDRHLQGGTPAVDVEYRVLHADGASKWLQMRGRCVRDEREAPVRMFLATHDVDARKQSEAARIALEARLQQARHMEALGTLAGGIAHDFNNLLGAILGFGEMARQLAGKGSPVGRHIERVLEAGGRARTLIGRILQFSRPGAAGKSPVNIQCVVQEAIMIHSPSLPEGVSVVSSLHAPEAMVAGDPVGLYHVVANLYTNALQAVGRSGEVRVALGTTVVTAREMPLHGELPSGRYVRLDVEDSGPGMSPETIGRIFEPFFTTKGQGDGTGLGLSVVHGIVSDLAGAIDVQSAPGAGTRISVWLPVAAPIDTAHVPPCAAVHGHGELILVVDDEQLLVELAMERLADLGYTALAYTSSQEALRAFLDAPAKIGLLLTDEKMPDLSGSELVAAIRERGHGVPVIMMSGNVTVDLEERAHAAGICALLRKPLTSEAMAEALDRCVRSKGPA